MNFSRKNVIGTMLLLNLLAAVSLAAANPVSLPALKEKQFDGRELKLVKVLAKNAIYTRYYITYKSGELTISGIMNVPKSRGPFPVIITNHGYINPAVYTNGRGLKREQDYLARHGYAVLHPDYRNHNGSDKTTGDSLEQHLGYVEDVINAVYAIKTSRLSSLDKERIGLLGHSLGGGIALSVMVTKPDLVKAYVLFAPMSSDYRDNYYRWIVRHREPKYGSPEATRQIIAKYGSPESNPQFWDEISAKTYIDEVKAPVLVHHGTADKSVPLAWSEKLAKLFSEHKKQLKLEEYPGEPHEFIKAWPLVMKRTVNFFDLYLR